MREVMLCRYSYDPLDRLVGTLPLSDAESQRFYCKNLLATEIQDFLTYSIFQHEVQPLAQLQGNEKTVKTSLLATDLQRSVINALNLDDHHPISYSPYGHRLSDSGLLSLFGFNGERQDPVTGGYCLGNGYRMFNPTLMRFNSPDSWSPFGNGGINSYAYCIGDPVNQSDPLGHSPAAILRFKIASFNKLHKDLSRAFSRASRATSNKANLKQHQAIQGLNVINDGRQPSVTLTRMSPASISDAQSKLKYKAAGQFKENHEAYTKAQTQYQFKNGIPTSNQTAPYDLTPFTTTLNHLRDQRTYQQFFDSKLTPEQISQKIRDTKLARDQFLTNLRGSNTPQSHFAPSSKRNAQNNLSDR
ncbi:RHS repeat-associated core domain-containing protein [Pseudomonas fluorescens]|uniref:RHS repeat-associated core domain-containing protein n=1 Tax=Pseudomonas fluorescens TaxID=294 RepID=UPI000AE254A0|nr:RHS repeat-associated core domain-containing protein [Pseudomonas fluorescens]